MPHIFSAEIKINNKLRFVVNLCTYENEQHIKNGYEDMGERREYEIRVPISNLSVCITSVCVCMC